ncbi:MAG TPA: hypothetical protein VGI10_11635 [Polyangiaceae bacterium]|jgi:hypothetical protein
MKSRGKTAKSQAPARTGAPARRAATSRALDAPLRKTSPSGARSASSRPASGRAAESARPGKRRLGMRGAAPWAARHAQKHAEEAAARNREPPKPGSARATLRTPDHADRIKQRISELHTVLVKIRGLRKNLAETFYQLGGALKQIQEQRLYDAKGYASFEAFVERELDLGKATALKLSRVPEIFLESAARRFGLEAVLAGLDALEQHASEVPASKPPVTRPALPLKPPK